MNIFLSQSKSHTPAQASMLWTPSPHRPTNVPICLVKLATCTSQISQTSLYFIGFGLVFLSGWDIFLANRHVTWFSILFHIFPWKSLVQNSLLVFAIRWAKVREAPLSTGFSRPEYWSIAIPFSRGSSWRRNRTCIAGEFFTFWATCEAIYIRQQLPASKCPILPFLVLFSTKAVDQNLTFNTFISLSVVFLLEYNLHEGLESAIYGYTVSLE